MRRSNSTTEPWVRRSRARSGPTSSPSALRAAGHEFAVPDVVDLELLRRVHDEEYVDFLATAWDRWVAEGKTAPAAMGFMWPTRGVPNRHVPTTSSGRSATTASPPTRRSSPALTAQRSGPLRSRRPLPTGCSTPVPTTYGLCRPPGHHAMADQFGGYCFFNNAAVAAQRLRDRGADRVGIIDVDYHHGNGTESIFLDRADVVFVSIHADPREEFPWFAGFADERGTGDGEGANLQPAAAEGGDVRRVVRCARHGARASSTSSDSMRWSCRSASMHIERRSARNVCADHDGFHDVG